MLKKLLFFVILISFTVESQHIISGEMSPINEEFTWVAIYQLKGAKQIFIGNSTISNGSFNVEIPEGKTSGMYRLRYKMDNQGFIDFIYSNDSIALKFDPNNPTLNIKYSNSPENELYTSFINETQFLRRKLDSIQYTYFGLKTKEEKDASNYSYRKIRKEYITKQNYFQEESGQQFVSNFIRASKKFYSNELFSSAQEYLNSEREHYFDFVDFTNRALGNSTFYSESILNYVFYLNESEDAKVQNILYKNGINNVMMKIGENVSLKSEVLTTLMYSFAQRENIFIVDFLIDEYYNELPEAVKNEDDLQTILDEVKFAVGRTVPDFSWGKNDEIKSLYKLNESKIYVLVFWSTSCSHCIIDMPILYEYTKNNKEIHVIGFALEEDELGFNYHTQKFENWTNILGLEKWQNPIARNYNIVSTPTYFILNADKKILAKPDSVEEFKSFFED